MAAVVSFKAPKELDMEWVKGDPVKLEEGKVYVIEFWATWCPPCRRSIPHLSAMAKKYSDVVFIGCTNEGREQIESFPMLKDMEYTVAGGDDAWDKFATPFGVAGIPAAFVVNKLGIVTWQGHPMDEMFEKSIIEARA